MSDGISDAFAMSESAPRNSDDVRWWIRRIKNYMIEDDEPLIKELNELLEDPNVDDLDIDQMKEWELKVEEVIRIGNVLDKYPIKKIEAYIRKKKLDMINRENENEGPMDMGSVSSSPL